jgi:hypothetical protein
MLDHPYCIPLTGQQIWTFKDENVLRVPRGIALDKNKNVYVAGRESKNECNLMYFVLLEWLGDSC